MKRALSLVASPASARRFAGVANIARNYATEAAKYNNILIEKKDKVAILSLNRPKALNALNAELCKELGSAVKELDQDDNIACIIITGAGEKAFCAGADIKEMQSQSFSDVYKNNLFGELEAVTQAKKPIIAAINGFALGGGCELAMMCDIAIASEKAKFGQPEITIGTIPGIGGTQRLTRLIGKPKAMEWILTGQFYSAAEAEKAGLVSRVVAPEKLMESALELANKIAKFSKPIVALAKETVNASYETTLREGLRLEKRVFQSTFATKDQKEGMAAFAEKREPKFEDK